MRTCTYYCLVYWADALTNCANVARWINDSTSNICYNFCTVLQKMFLITILFFRWHKISPEGYRQVFTKIDKHHLCQLDNVILDNLRGHDHMSKVTDVEVSAFSECFLFSFHFFFFFFLNKFGAMSLGCIKHSTNILSYHEGDKTSQVIDATGKWCGANGQSLHYLRPSGGRVANDIQKNICLAFLTSEEIWIRLSFYW